MLKYQDYQLVLEYLHRSREVVLEESKYYHSLQSRANKINKALKKTYNAKVVEKNDG